MQRFRLVPGRPVDDITIGCKPNAISGKASTANEYLRKQVKNTQSYNKADPNNGKWALKGEAGSTFVCQI
ncbi:unnamed protein product [Symbiodinium pilosum]|uniref:Uncharacterized protein n=1 Tax=Symbiodinium pilosum TaxID=2952 RepID=A0A812M3J8_SYMPI|nr:unnamed protein product [Symbiodinium pilosum]